MNNFQFKYRFKYNLALILLFCSNNLFSQLGFNLSGNTSGFYGSSSNDYNPINGYSISLYFIFDETSGKHLDLVEELSWITIGAEKKTNFVLTPYLQNTITYFDLSNKEIKLGYGSLSLHLKGKIFEQGTTPIITSGLFLSLLVKGRYKDLPKIATIDPINGQPYLENDLDYGPFFGVGLDFGKTGRYEDRLCGLELRYSKGLALIFSDNKEPILKNNWISLIFHFNFAYF
jgi:hypothetical protein